MRSLTIIFLLLIGSAAAYELKTDGEGHPVRWFDQPISYAIDADAARDIDDDDIERIVRASFTAWTLIPASLLRFNYEGFLEDQKPGYDRSAPESNHNAVIWMRDDWEFGEESLAITVTIFRRGTGELVDADILINERDYEWEEAGENDLQNSLTHEVGHFLGLGHSSEPEATMFATAAPHELLKRDLHEDDGDGIRALYPDPDSAPYIPPTPLSASERDDSVAPPAAEVQDDEEEWVAPQANVSCGISAGGAPTAPLLMLSLLFCTLRTLGNRR